MSSLHGDGSVDITMAGVQIWSLCYLPSGKHTNSYWKWQFIVDLPIKNGWIFHSYVNLQEGMFVDKKDPTNRWISHDYLWNSCLDEYVCAPNLCWLMVYLPLWKIWVRQLIRLFPIIIYIYGNIKFMFQTTNQFSMNLGKSPWFALKFTCGHHSWDDVSNRLLGLQEFTKKKSRFNFLR